MIHLRTFKIIVPLALALFFLFAHTAGAQRFQVQVQFGENFSKATIQDNGQSLRETSTFFDTVPNGMFGLAFNLKLHKHLYLRLDGSYRAYRTLFHTEEQRASGGESFISGNLFNEKFNIALLPELRFGWPYGERSRLVVYGFAGPVLSFEKGENYSEALVFYIEPSYVIEQIKPDAQSGWCFGGGFNPQFRRFGLLLEGRYTRFGYANEGLPVGKINYGHFTLLFGFTFNLGK